MCTGKLQLTDSNISDYTFDNNKIKNILEGVTSYTPRVEEKKGKFWHTWGMVTIDHCPKRKQIWLRTAELHYSKTEVFISK
jgi:hypothetical protein